MRLRNIQTGAVISCSDETAARLGAEWQKVEVEVEADKPKRSTRKKAEAAKD